VEAPLTATLDAQGWQPFDCHPRRARLASLRIVT
jgi:hypothetical protein